MADGDRERHGNRGGRGDGASQLNIEERRDNLPPIQQRLRTGYLVPNRNNNPVYAAPGKARALPAAGSFIPLAEQAWVAQAALVKDKRNGLGFDPARLFDGIVAAKSGIHALYDPARPSYASYDGLRTNLAILRNHLLSSGMDASRLKTIAEALGGALANDRWWKRPITRWISSDVANVESVGAGEMYKYLLEIQHKPALLQRLRVGINSVFGIADRNWGLPPLEATPFSPANLAAPLPAFHAADVTTPSPGFANRYRGSHSASPHLSKA